MSKKSKTAYVVAAHPLSLNGSPDDSCYSHTGVPTLNCREWALFRNPQAAREWALEKGIEMTDAHGYVSAVTASPDQKYANIL